jgi:uncharacterized protein YwgA
MTMDKTLQLGLIAKLSREVGLKNNTLGRKAFQKIVHLTNSLGGVPTGYSFSYYIYGAFSRELSSDLELAEMAGIVSSTQDASTGSYDIKAGELAPSAEKNASSFLKSQDKNLGLILAAFGDKSAKSLELYSTLVFVEQAEVNLRGDPDALVKRIKTLKPKYNDNEIRSAIVYIDSFRKNLN